MRTEQLTYFLTVAHSRSINQASEKLHISQQALSGAIKSLEDELAVALLKRQYAGVVLTERGQAFVQVAEQILKLLADYKEEGCSYQKELTGHVLIYAVPVVQASELVHRIIPDFCKAHPAVQIDLVEMDGELICEQLRKPCADGTKRLAFLGGEDVQVLEHSVEGYVFQPLYSGTFYIGACQQSPLAQYKQLSVKTLLKYPFVFYGSGHVEDTVPYHFIQQYGKPQVALSTHSEHLYLKAMADGIGIGFVFEGILKDALYADLTSQLAIIEIKEGLSATIGYLLSEQDQGDVLLEALVRYIRQQLGS